MTIIRVKKQLIMKGKLTRWDGSYYNYEIPALAKTEAKAAKEEIIFKDEFKKRQEDIKIRLSAGEYIEEILGPTPQIADYPKSKIKEYKKNYDENIAKAKGLFKPKTQIRKDRLFNSVCEDFLNRYVDVKESTKKTKEDDLKRPIAKFGDRDIVSITSEELQEYIWQLDYEISERSVKKIFYAMNPVFQLAVEKGYIPANPMGKVKRRINKDKPREEMKIWEPDEFQLFLDEFPEKDRFYYFFEFLYFMGTRSGEANALTWNDIHFNENTVEIKKSVSFKLRPYKITSPKNPNAHRKISMPKRIHDSLKELYKLQKEYEGFTLDCFVFGFDKPLDPETVRRVKREKVKAANEKDENKNKQLELIRVHDFRHSHASYLINNMSDQFTDFDVAKRLGDTVQTLHNTYAHWFKQRDKSIIDFMDKDACKKKDDDFKRTNAIRYDELKALKELLDNDIITKEEFEIKKKEFLGI